MNTKINPKGICFIKRKSDGKFLRGSRFFPWVKTWRNSAMLSPSVVKEYFDSGVLARYNITCLSQIELVTQRIK